MITIMKEAKERPTWLGSMDKAELASLIFRLQDEVGLTFKEAYSVLTPFEATKELMKKWDCTDKNVLNLRRKGWNKIYAYTDDEDLRLEFAPTLYWHVL
jgi:hypothetical protein